MATPPQTMLTEAIAAARAGDRSRARDLLSRLLRSDSSNPEYWIWMSAVVESQRERVYCLESAIKLDPTNRAAMRGLVILGSRTPEDAELASALRIPRRQIEAISKGPALGRLVGFPWKWVGAVAGGLAGIVIIWGVVNFIGPWIRSLVGTYVYRPASTLPPITATPSLTSIGTTPSATPPAAATRVMRTPIRPEFAATPLSLLISETATPTPILGMTPRPAYGAYDSGINALIRGQYTQVIMFMDQVIALDPDLPDAYYFKGEAYRLMGEIAEAISAYDRAKSMDEDFAPTYLGRGRVLLERDENAAIDDFNRALLINPSMTEAYLELGSYYASKRLWLKLASTMEKALNAGVTTPMIYIRLAQAQMQLNQQVAALENALEGSANDPGLLLGYLVVGQAYVAVGVDTFEESNFTAAVWPLQTYLTYSQEDNRGWAFLARAWASLGQYEDALSAVNYSLELEERYAPAYIARSIIFMAQGEYEAAFEDLKSARRYGPETFDLVLMTARAYYLLGENEDALDYVNDALSMANEERTLAEKEVKLGEGYALRALISETNPDPDMQSYALLNWRWVARLTYVRPETLAMAEAHIAELTGQAPTRTPTASPTATSTSTHTSTATPTRTPTSPTSTSAITGTLIP